MIALGYARRSRESTERTVSLVDQQSRISAYCAERGWTLAEIVTDDGVSGGRRERLVRLTEKLRTTRARVVVAYAIDRMARDAAGLLDWIERAGRSGIELHIVGRGKVEVQSAAGYLVTGIEAVVAGHYRKIVGEKTAHALARLRSQGRRISGRLPYGSKLAPDGLHLAPDLAEEAILGLICTFAAGGLSLRAISRRLADVGILARSGRPFTASTLAPMVRLVRDRAVTDSAGAAS